MAWTQSATAQVKPSPVNTHSQLIDDAALVLSDKDKAWLAAHPVIHVGMDPDYAPYEWIDENGDSVGMSVDYIGLLENKLGVHFEIVKNKSWLEVQEMAKRGEVDMLTSIVQTPKRLKYLVFTEPYRDIQTVIIDNGQGGFIGNLEHLMGKRVVVEKGYFTQELLEENYPQIQLMLAGSTLEALNMVADGKADAYVGDIASTNYVIKKNGLHKLRFSGQTEYLSQHRMAFPKAKTEQALIIMKAMASIPKEESDALFNRWMGLEIKQGVSSESLIKYGSAIALLLLLFSYWVYRLRREVGFRKASEARAGFLANHDRLTELPNRELFYDRLSQAVSQARRKNEGLALLFLDLDGFKSVNDTHGHEAGDVVLKVVAKRLQACIRNMDTVARMGGDEFSIILTSVQSTVNVETVAQKIILNIAEAIKLNPSTTCGVGISIGIAIYPDNGTEIDVLMNAADCAMYESKAAGKNTSTISQLKNNHQASNAPWIRLDGIPLLGVQIIDDQHLKIVGMINGLNDSLKHNDPTKQLLIQLEDLINFTDFHFKTEERLMKEYSYPEEIEHQNTHDNLLQEVTHLKEKFAQGAELVLLQKLKDWFAVHITSSDKSLADFIIQQDAK
jgi:diguanylate cyclase (GGDEF)-like protein/hemerythrin-like metal-binding protein